MSHYDLNEYLPSIANNLSSAQKYNLFRNGRMEFWPAALVDDKDVRIYGALDSTERQSARMSRIGDVEEIWR